MGQQTYRIDPKYLHHIAEEALLLRSSIDELAQAIHSQTQIPVPEATKTQIASLSEAADGVIDSIRGLQRSDS